MQDWNVVVTALTGGRRERLLLRELRQLGEFRPTGFRSVFLGRVPEREKFLEDLREACELMPEAFSALGQVVPIEETHTFEPGGFEEALTGAALPYAGRIGPRKFIVRLKRRGYKGLISSPEVEHGLADLLLAETRKMGHEPRVGFEDPDLILVVELFPNRFGLALISREMKQRYPFIKVS